MEKSRKNKMIEFWMNEVSTLDNDVDEKLSTKDDVESFEARHEVALPSSFVDFVVNCGACSFNELDWHCSIINIDLGERAAKEVLLHNYIRNIRQIDDALEQLNQELPDFWETGGALIPPKMIPIGDSLWKENGFLLMDLSENHYGSLWHWRFIQEAWGDEENSMLLKVSDSFDIWLDELKSWDEADLIVSQEDGKENES
ncbi:SMI1 / KNR4 family protein [Grimontia celer]|uniref:SMI1 / KNR4 family protein n=1 Tax=Grimontia celer TaxID=1796497 RepID=A0A128F2M8_9GAMM|nr:SMI1/KNR4 family protein [Grimontia celer]CZF80680.1 SMI1 / KNR4 family protein [Grimontia celer]